MLGGIHFNNGGVQMLGGIHFNNGRVQMLGGIHFNNGGVQILGGIHFNNGGVQIKGGIHFLQTSPNKCGPPVRNVLTVALLVPRNSRYFVDFWGKKISTPKLSK